MTSKNNLIGVVADGLMVVTDAERKTHITILREMLFTQRVLT